MQIQRAREMGFCFGVRRAITILERAVAKHGLVETLGEVVHNRQVVERLAQKGVLVAESLDKMGGKTVAITSHGVEPGVVAEMRARGLKVIDATCPFVRKAQRTAQTMAQAGFFVVLFGDAEHPEVRGVLGWAGQRGVVTDDPAQAASATKRLKRVGILSQTTQSLAHYSAFVQELTRMTIGRTTELRMVNTICDATTERQTAALELARRVDLMLVIGGYHSANTRRLAELCTESRVETHHIETAADLDPSWLHPELRVGITAGASTPDDVIEEVVACLKKVARAWSTPVRQGA